jgi:hypothetical protein
MSAQQQRESLVAIYRATGGGEGRWSHADNWGDHQNLEEGSQSQPQPQPQPQPVSSFYGVAVDESGAVVGLDLADNGLAGA